MRAFPGVELIEPGRNLGFAAATNLALARGRARYFLALNPDTRVHAGTLDTLLELMDADPSIGDLRLPARARGRHLRPCGEAFVPDAARRARALHPHRPARARPGALAQYRAPEVERGRVDAVNGAFMLMRRSALDELGPFDEGYWMYMEDLDLCYRAAEAGWVTWYEPSVDRHARQGGHERPPPQPPAELRVPLRDGPLLPAALRARARPRRSTPRSTPGSAPSSRSP